jgi:hypothetical protein
MQLPSLLARWLRARDTSSFLMNTARRDALGSEFRATASADREAGGETEELFRRRFQQLVAGGWSFRAAAIVALFETTINSPASERHSLHTRGTTIVSPLSIAAICQSFSRACHSTKAIAIGTCAHLDA